MALLSVAWRDQVCLAIYRLPVVNQKDALSLLEIFCWHPLVLLHPTVRMTLQMSNYVVLQASWWQPKSVSVCSL